MLTGNDYRLRMTGTNRQLFDRQSQQTQDVESMMALCWASVSDAGQHKAIIVLTFCDRYDDHRLNVAYYDVNNVNDKLSFCYGPAAICSMPVFIRGLMHHCGVQRPAFVPKRWRG